MGFSSMKCTLCGRPVAAHAAVRKQLLVPQWMTEITVVRPDGFSISGVYDGYGRVFLPEDGKKLWEYDILPGHGGPNVWEDVDGEALYYDVRHTGCTEGVPLRFQKRSESCDSQGFFFRRGMFEDSLPLKVPGLLDVRIHADHHPWVLSGLDDAFSEVCGAMEEPYNDILDEAFSGWLCGGELPEQVMGWFVRNLNSSVKELANDLEDAVRFSFRRVNEDDWRLDRDMFFGCLGEACF